MYPPALRAFETVILLPSPVVEISMLSPAVIEDVFILVSTPFRTTEPLSACASSVPVAEKSIAFAGVSPSAASPMLPDWLSSLTFTACIDFSSSEFCVILFTAFRFTSLALISPSKFKSSVDVISTIFPAVMFPVVRLPSGLFRYTLSDESASTLPFSLIVISIAFPSAPIEPLFVDKETFVPLIDFKRPLFCEIP